MTEWFYIDDEGTEQGPYTFESICAWFNDSYFDESTLLRHADAAESTKLGDLAEFDHLLDTKKKDETVENDDDDDADDKADAAQQHEPLTLDGVVVPPPPGWNGEPIVSNAVAVQQATQEIADVLAAMQQQQAPLQTGEMKRWSDAEFEMWSLTAQRMIATPQSLPAAIWQQLELERRERHRIAAMAAKFMKEHQIKGIKRKKYSWSTGFKNAD